MNRTFTSLILFCAIFVVAASAGSSALAQYTISDLAAFNSTNGSSPEAGLLADASGNLYGTTAGGGANNLGTAFKIATGTNALSTLATFNSTNGSSPSSTLIADASGNLYGTTYLGGPNGGGSVFQIATGTNALNTLASFNGSNGGNLIGGVIADAGGNLYGTTIQGGLTGDGTVYAINANTHAITTLASFNGTNGQWPQGSLVADASGNLYGITQYGGPGFLGNSSGVSGNGTVFEINANTHAITTLVAFNGTNGAGPQSGLTISSGNLYGTTRFGGPAFSGSSTSGNGTVFEINAGTQAFSTLASFNNVPNSFYGFEPISTPLIDASGNLFGTTIIGGNADAGTVFEIAAGTQAFRTLASFSETNGDEPSGNLVADASGNLYGTTYVGGVNGMGTVFELSLVPEPSTLALALLGGAALGVAAARRLRQRRLADGATDGVRGEFRS